MFTNTPPTTLVGQCADRLNIVQLSDLHIHHVTSPVDTASMEVHEPALLQIFRYLMTHRHTIDLIVVTGDLVHDVAPANYDYIFSKLADIGVAFICQAGNHDVTQELDIERPFDERRHVAVSPDTRLIAGNHAIETPSWQLLFINSAIAGHIAGFYEPATLTWVNEQLQSSEKPCVIFTHHPSWSVQSKWVDEYQLTNSEEFWQAIAPNLSKLKAIFSGHVHQDSHHQYQHVQLYTVPSTKIQFLPLADEFTLDLDNTAGLRQITLYNNATLATHVKRMDTTELF